MSIPAKTNSERRRNEHAAAEARKLKHLDTALAIFKGSPAAKRPTRKAQVELVAMMVSDISYVVTSNGKIVESGEGSAIDARQRMSERALTLRGMGKTVSERFDK